MKTLYLNGWEVSANLEDRRVVVSHRTTGEVQKVALFSLQRVVCVGQPHLTMPLLHELMRQNITIVFLNGHGECLNAIYPNLNGNAPRRLRQYAVASDPNRSLPIAKALIDAKIRNLRRTLQRLAGTRGLTEQPAHRQAMDTLQDCRGSSRASRPMTPSEAARASPRPATSLSSTPTCRRTCPSS